MYLNATRSKHHIEAEAADLGHVVEHDLVAALGHPRKLGAGLVRPHPGPQKSEAQPVADGLALIEMPRRLGAGLVKRPERRAAELELTGGLEADVAVHALQRDHLAVFEH